MCRCLLAFVLLFESMIALTSVAWFYGDTVPITQLNSKFEVVVVNEGTINPSVDPNRYYCYISIGEVLSSMRYFKSIPKSWIMGQNPIWGSYVIDLTAPGYAEFFATNVTGPLWKNGFRGFFIDTMDSYQLYRSGAAADKQVAAEVHIIKVLKTHFPTAKLIYNRGFEIYSQTYNLVYAVAFESLTKTYSNGAYGLVGPVDRSDLMASVAMIRKYTPNKPIISIDYCPQGNTLCQNQAIANATARNLLCYTSNIDLNVIGKST